MKFKSPAQKPFVLSRSKHDLNQPTTSAMIAPSNGSPDALLHLILPVPPSINHQYATVHGRRVLSSAGRRFKFQVGQEVLCAIAARRRGRPFPKILDEHPLALDLRFYFESGLRRDIDGGLKITQDAVCEALGINDNRIVEVTLRKDTDRATPRMELVLRIAHP